MPIVFCFVHGRVSSAIEDSEIEKAAVFDDEEIRELQVYYCSAWIRNLSGYMLIVIMNTVG